MFERFQAGIIPIFDGDSAAHCYGDPHTVTTFRVIWLRREFEFRYTTPRVSAKVRREREQEKERLARVAERALRERADSLVRAEGSAVVFDGGYGPEPGLMDWTDQQEERAAGLPSAMPVDYQDPGLTAALAADDAEGRDA